MKKITVKSRPSLKAARMWHSWCAPDVARVQVISSCQVPFRNYLGKHTSSAGASKCAKMLRDLLPGRMRGLLRLPMRNFVAGSALLVLLAGVSHAKTKSHPASKTTHHTVGSSSKNHKPHGHPRTG